MLASLADVGLLSLAFALVMGAREYFDRQRHKELRQDIDRANDIIVGFSEQIEDTFRDIAKVAERKGE
jgi:hypothetical protein